MQNSVEKNTVLPPEDILEHFKDSRRGRAIKMWKKVASHALKNGFEEDAERLAPKWYHDREGRIKINRKTRRLIEIMGMVDKDFKITLPPVNELPVTDEDIAYKRLEFIGDSLVETILTHYYIKEGVKRRNVKEVVNTSVSNHMLGIAGKKANLEVKKKLYKKEKRYGSAFEYEVGRLLEEEGYDKAFRFVEKWLIPVIEELVDRNTLLL